MAISSFRMNTKESGVVLVIEPADAFNPVMVDVYIKVGQQPTVQDFDLEYKLPHNLEVWDMNEEYDNWKIFIPIETVKIYSKKLYSQPNDVYDLGDIWYVGVIRSQNDFNVLITVVTPSCRTFNEDLQVWESGNCILGENTNLVDVDCQCTQPAGPDPNNGLVVGTEFFSPPNSIDFGSVFSKFDLNDNPAVFITIIVFFVLYIMMVLCGTLHWDRRDRLKWKVRQLHDNYKYPERKSCLYQVTISTGGMPYSGTESQVFLQLYPLNEATKMKPRVLKDTRNKTITFPRGTVKNFIMREKNVDQFSHLHIWHDNKGGDWNCDTIIIKNLETYEVHYFYVRDWLSVEHGNFMVDKTVPASDPDDSFDNFSDLFKATLWLKLIDDHLWLSVFLRGFKSNFNRTQRITCCFVLVFITFIANCMWFETGKQQAPILSIGPLEMTSAQIWASIAAALVAVPPITVIILLFQRTTSEEDDKFQQEVARRKTNGFTRSKSGHSLTSLRSMNTVKSKKVHPTNGRTDSLASNHFDDVAAKPDVWQFPRWTVYLWYLLSFVAMGVSAFFCILYSMEWGKAKSERWLTNAIMTFFLDILIMQPLKVALLVLVVGIILKKIQTTKVLLKSASKYEILDASLNDKPNKFDNGEGLKRKAAINRKFGKSEKGKDAEEEIQIPKPPTLNQLKFAKWNRKNEKRMIEVIYEFFGHCLYLAVLFILCGLLRGDYQYTWISELKEVFDDEVNSIGEFWDWIDETAIPNIYKEYDYLGKG